MTTLIHGKHMTRDAWKLWQTAPNAIDLYRPLHYPTVGANSAIASTDAAATHTQQKRKGLFWAWRQTTRIPASSKGLPCSIALDVGPFAGSQTRHRATVNAQLTFGSPTTGRGLNTTQPRC